MALRYHRRMSWIQRFVCAFVRPELRERIEAESREWGFTCPACAARRSVWELGGMRYRGSSQGKRTRLRCGGCGQTAWMQMERTAQR